SSSAPSRPLPRLPPPSTPFPYTTLFRSHEARPVLLQPVARRRPREGTLPAHDARRVQEEEPEMGDRPRPRRAREAGERELGVERSEEHTSELQSRENLVCRLLLEKKNTR